MFSKKGFTIIELLIVLAIIGILSASVVAVLNPTHFRAKARDGKRKADLEQARSQLEMCRADDGTYVGCSISGICVECYFTSGPGTTSYRLCIQLECNLEGTDCSAGEIYCQNNP